MIVMSLSLDGNAVIISPQVLYQGSDSEKILILSPFPTVNKVSIAGVLNGNIVEPVPIIGTSKVTAYHECVNVPLPAIYADRLSAWEYTPSKAWTAEYGTLQLNALVSVSSYDYEDNEPVYATKRLTTFMCQVTIEEAPLPSYDDPEPEPEPEPVIIGSNPNILINSNFIINQRGQSTYTEAGKYGLDHWRLGSYGGTLTQRTDAETGNVIGMRLQANEGSVAYINQYLENGYERLKGEKVILSMRLADGTILETPSAQVPTILPEEQLVVTTLVTDTCSFGFILNTSGKCFVQIGVTEVSGYIDVDYIKMELGEYVTQYTPKTYEEELSNCQRYYFRIKSGDMVGMGVSVSSTQINVLGAFPVQMRTTPTLTISDLNGIYIYAPGVFLGNPTAYVRSSGKYTYELVLSVSSISSGLAIECWTSGAYISCDAEMY